LAKAPGLVGPVLASLHRDRGFTPGDLVYLVGQLRGLSTGAVDFRSVPGTTTMVRSYAVVKMDPSANEIFRAVQEGRSITDVGTELESTAPSEANTTVLVLDTGNPTGAAATEDILLKAGFDVSPGVVAGQPPQGMRHAVIAYEPGQENYAKVVSTYFPDLKMVQVKKLDVPVVVVVPAGYTPADPGEQGSGDQGGGGQGGTPPTPACPTPTA
jgi:hypothetical protein